MIDHADLSHFAALVYRSGLVVRLKFATSWAIDKVLILGGHSQETALFDRSWAESLPLPIVILSSYSKLF